MAKFTSLIWGSTGSGKTDCLRGFAEGLYKTTGKKTRLVSAERAQSEPILREGIEEGYILPWWLDARRDEQGNVEFPFEQITEAVLGKWPVDLANPYSQLVPAFSIQYKAVCREVTKHTDKQEKLLYQSDKAPTSAASLICPTCKTTAIAETHRVLHDKRLEEVGCYIMDGATEFGDMMMKDMSVRTAKLQTSGQASAGSGLGGTTAIAFKDGDYVVGGSTQNHYGTAQRRIKNKIDESKHLPVDYAWWTAARESGEDDERGKIIISGPKIPGSAATSDIPRWFGMTLSTCVKPVDFQGQPQPEHRLYLKSYYMDWIPIIAKRENLVDNRIPATNLADIPQYVHVDHTKKEIVVAGVKMAPRQLLWDICQLIRARQAPVKVQPQVAQQQVTK